MAALKVIDHITFGVRDFEASCAFYDPALQSLGIHRLVDQTEDGVRIAGYGKDRPRFWLVHERATRGLFHIAFEANTRSDVDRFYACACELGGVSNGPPGLRPHYHPHYYAAYVLDPDGHNIEAVCLDQPALAGSSLRSE